MRNAKAEAADLDEILQFNGITAARTYLLNSGMSARQANKTILKRLWSTTVDAHKEGLAG
ncbi:MAG: hypothetical protein JWO13_2729 [Acidobacteriales bacterium]|nr:hypothetical protein [Terriglobales bacterium]